MICLLVCSSSPASFIWKVKQIRFMLYLRQTAVAPTKIEGVATAAFHANVDNCFFLNAQLGQRFLWWLTVI